MRSLRLFLFIHFSLCLSAAGQLSDFRLFNNLANRAYFTPSLLPVFENPTSFSLKSSFQFGLQIDNNFNHQVQTHSLSARIKINQSQLLFGLKQLGLEQYQNRLYSLGLAKAFADDIIVSTVFDLNHVSFPEGQTSFNSQVRIYSRLKLLNFPVISGIRYPLDLLHSPELSLSLQYLNKHSLKQAVKICIGESVEASINTQFAINDKALVSLMLAGPSPQIAFQFQYRFGAVSSRTAHSLESVVGSKHSYSISFEQ